MARGISLAGTIDNPCQKLLFASDLAWVSVYRGEYERAFRFFMSVQGALDTCQTPYYRAKYFLDLARLHHLAYDRDDILNAETHYFTALEEARKASSTPGLVCTCLYYLGLLYYDVGNKGEAKRIFDEGLAAAKTRGATREADRHHSMLAQILADNGQYDKAKEILDRIIVNAEAHEDFVRVADFRLGLAKVEFKVGNRRGARALLTGAAKIYDELGRFQDVSGITQFCRKTGLTPPELSGSKST